MQSKFVNFSLMCAGWLAMVLAVLGVILPLLPTTPFVLLAATCFAKSSPKFHAWLLNQKFFGEIIRNYQTYGGMTLKSKKQAILLIWIGMSISIILMQKLMVAFILIAIGLSVSTYLWRLPCVKN